MYALFIIGGAFGGGIMFPGNQSYDLFGKLIGIPNYLYGIILAILVGIVIIGGIKRIGQTTERIVPFMVFLYDVLPYKKIVLIESPFSTLLVMIEPLAIRVLTTQNSPY